MSFQLSRNREKFKVKLYVRMFPTEHYDWDCIKTDVDKKILYVRHLFQLHSSKSIELPPKFWCFKTSGIFLNSCQNEVYLLVVSDIFLHILHGVDHTLMSYGQNYSGKSFTMSGFYNQYELRGIIPRFVVDLFEHLETKVKDYTPKVYLSVVEVHNNFVYDMLSRKKGVWKNSKNVREVEVLSGLECLELLFKAEARRIIVKNKSYNSHYSTNVVTLRVRLISANCNEPLDKISKIHFVDLAGVETVFINPLSSFKDQYNQGDANVTKSLLELYALRLKHGEKQNNMCQNMHALTRYLNKSFSSTACISFICHIRPHHEDIKISLSALKFGRIFQGVPLIKPEEHIETNYDMQIEKLNREIKILKDEFLMLDFTDIKSPIKISQDRIDFAKRAVLSFLNGEISEKDLLSLIDDPNLILNLIKSIHNQPIAKSSVTLQTDFISYLMDHKDSDKDQRRSITKRTLSKESTKGKSVKVGGTVKSKTNENVAVQSVETQVNLLEPNVTQPNFASRENLWAMFLISRPDIHDILEKLNTSVTEKKKQLNYELSLYDDLTQSINKKQLVLSKLVTYRQTDSREIYDQDGKVMIPQDEADIVQNLRQLQRDLEISKQKLINVQFDWLESLEKLSNETVVIEKNFKQFCVEKSCVAIESPTSEEGVAVRQNQSISSEDIRDITFKTVYHTLQKKHLHQNIIKYV